MDDFTINDTLPLLAIRKLAFAQLAGIYFDVVYVKELQKTWQNPVGFLLKALCKGDLPLFLANIRGITMRFPMNENGQIQRYCAPFVDRVIAARLLNVARLFFKPLAAAWHLNNIDDGFDLFYGLLLMPRYRNYQIHYQEDTVKLYNALGCCSLEKIEIEKPTMIAKEIESNSNMPQRLPQLSHDTDPKTVYRLAELLIRMRDIKESDQFNREHRQLFITLYQKDDQLDLSLQLKVLAEMHKEQLAKMQVNPRRLSDVSIQFLDQKPSSLSDEEYVPKDQDWLRDTQESELLHKEGMLQPTTLPGAMLVKQDGVLTYR